MELLLATYHGDKLRAAGQTRHVVSGKEVAGFDKLKIVQFGTRDFNLHYFEGDTEVTDTGFGTLQECCEQAQFEFGIDTSEWTWLEPEAPV